MPSSEKETREDVDQRGVIIRLFTRSIRKEEHWAATTGAKELEGKSQSKAKQKGEEKRRLHCHGNPLLRRRVSGGRKLRRKTTDEEK